MDEEEHGIQHQEIQEMLFFLKDTYSGRTTEEVRRAEDRITNILQNHPSFLPKMFDFLTSATTDTQFKLATANIIKKQYYQIAERPQLNKKEYVLAAYQFLLTTNPDNIRLKEQIGSALQFILNKDEKMQYKNQVANDCFAKISSFVQQIQNWSMETTLAIHGIAIAYIAYMNSLVEPEDLLEFILKVLPGLCLSASICLRFAVDNIHTSTPPPFLFLAGNKIFQLFEIAIQRLLDQEDLLGDDLLKLKNSQMLQNVITDYLFAENIDSSILCPYGELNETKQSAMQILNLLNVYNVEIPKSIINTLLYTFLKESTQNSIEKRQDDDDDYKEQILCRVMEILESCLEAKKYYSLFLDYKVAILFALMMYSRTDPSEEQNLYEEPKKFAEVAEEYSQCFARSPLLKVRAASFLRAYLKNIDEGIKNLTELLTIFITSSLCVDQQDSPILAQFKQDLGKFDFWGLTNRQKLDVSFMVLTVMAPLVQSMPQVLEVIYSLLAVHSKFFSEIKDELVLCRLIRLIGYYPFASFFYFIQEKMSLNKACQIEGIMTFERIIKNQEYLKTFPLMYSVFLQMIDMIELSQSIFEQLMLNHYSDIICKSDQLYKKIVEKLWNTFKNSFGSSQMHQMQPLQNKHQAIQSLNYLEKLLRKERREKNNNMLLETFLEMENIGKCYEILDDNIICIYHTIINKFLAVDQKVEAFGMEFSTPLRLQRSTFPTEFFLFLNKLILKTDNFLVIQRILTNLEGYLLTAHEERFDKRLLPHLTFIIGQIITDNLSVQISQKAVDYVLEWVMVKNNRENTSYQSMLFLCLHYINLKPAQIREYLLLKDVYYSFMVKIFQANLSTKTNRKAAVLSMNSLLVYEPERKLTREIIKYCIKTLSVQRQRYQSKAIKPNIQRMKTDVTMRRVLNMNFFDEGENGDMVVQQKKFIQQERMQNDDEAKQNNDVFKGLKHPFDKIDEFEAFKYGLQSISDWRELVDPADLQTLSNIFSTEWFKEKVRSIVKVRKDVQ